MTDRKVTPILMQPDMILATLREIREPGTGKWQTRRVLPKAAAEAAEFVSGGPDDAPGTTDNLGLMYGQHEDDAGEVHNAEWLVYCAECPEEGVIPIGQGYGQPGDLLAIRETMRVIDIINHGSRVAAIRVRYEADGAESDWIEWPERLQGLPEIGKCLPYGGYREAWRITGVLADVRVERVQDINDFDAQAEGVEWDEDKDGRRRCVFPRDMFQELWDRINAARGYGWDANPWVWVLSYKPHLINVDEFLKRRAA